MSWVLVILFAGLSGYLAYLLLKQKGPKHQKETEDVKKLVFVLSGAYRAKELKVISAVLHARVDYPESGKGPNNG